MKTVGIYVIVNLVNWKCYVGQSSNIEKRCQEYFARLRRGYHPNRFLQLDFSGMGEQAFEHWVLSEFPGLGSPLEVGKWLNKMEKLWIVTCNSQEAGYNVINGGSSLEKFKPKEERDFWKLQLKLRVKRRKYRSSKQPSFRAIAIKRMYVHRLGFHKNGYHLPVNIG